MREKGNNTISKNAVIPGHLQRTNESTVDALHQSLPLTTCFSPIQSTVHVELDPDTGTMENPLRNLFHRGKSTSGSTTPIANSIPMTQSMPSQASFTLPTVRLPIPEPLNVLSQSTPTPPILNLPMNQPSAPALLTVPTSPADHVPNITPITNNPPHILPAMPLAESLA